MSSSLHFISVFFFFSFITQSCSWPLIKNLELSGSHAPAGTQIFSHTLHGLAITEISIYWTDKRPHVRVDAGWKPKILRKGLSESSEGPRERGSTGSGNDEMAAEGLG